MNIIETKHQWNGVLAKRNSTNYIILHHRAGNGTVEGIHAQHLSQGWSGIGYHFYVRKDGTVYRGRPMDFVGAHCTHYNNTSIGICFEGNFEKETMTSAQIKAGQELVAYVKSVYPLAEIKKHRELGSTACPGKNFPFDEIVNGKVEIGEEQMTVDEAIKTVQTKAGFEDSTIEFLLCYKYGEELMLKLAEAMN